MSNQTDPFQGFIIFGPNANCNLELCPAQWSILGYRPAKPATGVFISLFGLALTMQFIQGIRYKTWSFTITIICGCVLEILGYVGRLIMYNNPFDFNGFLLQIICITIAPVFFCAAIYVLLAQIINQLDRSMSRASPRLLYWIFIPCDIISLILQATGGALSCVAETVDAVQKGVDISKAGLIFQAITLGIFCAFFADFWVRYHQSSSRQRTTLRLKTFLTFLFLSITLIFVRCVYRIIELQHGYFSEFFKEQWPFVGLESVVMSIAVLCLNIGHPGIVFRRHRKSKESSAFSD